MAAGRTIECSRTCSRGVDQSQAHRHRLQLRARAGATTLVEISRRALLSDPLALARERRPERRRLGTRRLERRIGLTRHLLGKRRTERRHGLGFVALAPPAHRDSSRE
jgi:hypothetical protein